MEESITANIAAMRERNEDIAIMVAALTASAIGDSNTIHELMAEEGCRLVHLLTRFILSVLAHRFVLVDDDDLHKYLQRIGHSAASVNAMTDQQIAEMFLVGFQPSDMDEDDEETGFGYTDDDE